ncbi:MAG: hypothetical protein PUC94_08325 [Bacteroidales bacterium]|nr:hypothetical protein [Bacteroidales bacterium]
MDFDALKGIPEIPGVYIIVAADGTKFQYPQGKSSVMYIGMSKNLQNRLVDHYMNTRKIAAELENYSRMDCQCSPRVTIISENLVLRYMFSHVEVHKILNVKSLYTLVSSMRNI